MSLHRPVRVLFVCLGNICRSPLAEAIFRQLAEERGLADRFVIDSAGTSAYHAGEPPDPGARRVAERYGIRLAHVARQVRPDELAHWDLLVAMDERNARALERLGAPPERVLRIRDFDPEGPGDVPDPYGRGEEAFERVFGILHRSCLALLEALAPGAGQGRRGASAG